MGCGVLKVWGLRVEGVGLYEPLSRIVAKFVSCSFQLERLLVSLYLEGQGHDPKYYFDSVP